MNNDYAQVDVCSTYPKVFFEQTVVWKDAKGRLWPIRDIQWDHLTNLLNWITVHARHWKGYDVLKSPLMKALLAEADRRLKEAPAKFKTTTTNPPLTTAGATAAFRTVLVELSPSVKTRGAAELGLAIRDALKKKGYAIYQIPTKGTAKPRKR